MLAKAVFVNYGREEDYNALGAMGVNVTGCVVIARRSEVLSRGGVVRVAQKMGALAVLLYAEGDRFRDGVERGTVMGGIGDPLSPGWAAEAAGGERLDAKENEVLKRFTKVPSLPISSYTAEAILRTLDGDMVPYEWRDTLKFKIGGVGSGPPLINFTYQGEKRMATIYNVFAVIRGSEEPDRYVLLGNHRDAWTFGAVDPNSGTATLLDIARRFALLLRLGWVPRRTIILCSWDAEEFGMIGSTEWVEQNLLNLGSKAVVYLNVDCAVQGPGFFPSATPQLDDLIVEVTKKVKDPDSEGSTLYEKWTTVDRDLHVGQIQRLSEVDSDFAPFLQHAGIPAVDLHYGRDFPVYHTAFDSFSWMEKYGDPSFQRHVAVAEIWGLLALHLADDRILPFNYLSYASELQEYVSVLKDLLGDTVSLHPIITSIQELTCASKEIEEESKKLREQEAAGDLLTLKTRMINDRLMLAERGFLESDGLHGRQWFKHLVYGPCGDCESKLSFFPGIANAISQSDGGNRKKEQAAIQHEIWRVARAIQRAAHALTGELT